MRRPEVFGGRRFLLKSIHYDATHRADLFTLPCRFKVGCWGPLGTCRRLGCALGCSMCARHDCGSAAEQLCVGR